MENSLNTNNVVQYWLERRNLLYQQLEQEGAFKWVSNRPEWNERDQEEYFRKRNLLYQQVLNALQQKNIDLAKQKINELLNWELNYWASKSKYYHSNMSGLGYSDIEKDAQMLEKIQKIEQYIKNPSVIEQEIQQLINQRKQQIEQELQRKAQQEAKKKQLILQNVANLQGNQRIAQKMIEEKIDKPFKQLIEQRNKELQEYAQKTQEQVIQEKEKEIERVFYDVWNEYRNDYLQELYSRNRRYREEDRKYLAKLKEQLKNSVQIRQSQSQVGTKIDENKIIEQLKNKIKQKVWQEYGANIPDSWIIVQKQGNQYIARLDREIPIQLITKKEKIDEILKEQGISPDDPNIWFQMSKDGIIMTKIKIEEKTKVNIIVDKDKLKITQLKNEHPILFSSYQKAYELIGKNKEEAKKLAMKATEEFLKDLKRNNLLKFSVGISSGILESHYIPGVITTNIVKNPVKGTQSALEGTYEYFKDLVTNPNAKNIGNFIGWTIGSVLPTSKYANILVGASNLLISPLEGLKVKERAKLKELTKEKQKVKGNIATQREYIEWLKERLLEGKSEDVKISIQNFLKNIEKQYKEGKLTKEQYEKQKAMLIGSIQSALFELGVKLETKKEKTPVIKEEKIEIPPINPKLYIKKGTETMKRPKIEMKPIIPVSIQKEIQQQIEKQKTKQIQSPILKQKIETFSIQIPKQIEKQIQKTKTAQITIQKQLEQKIQMPRQKTIQLPTQIQPNIQPLKVEMPTIPRTRTKSTMSKMPKLFQSTLNLFSMPKSRKRNRKYDYFELKLPIPRAFKDLKI